MGLRESRIINEVHPWLGVRLQWMEDVAVLYRTFQVLLSGNRTRAEQLRLYNFQSKRPAAYPGCSQHQYGFAADASWAPMTTVTSKGKLFSYGEEFTIRTMNNAARHVGLHLVAGDTGHFQAYNGGAFRNWAVSTGACPANPPPPQWNFSQVQSSNDAWRECLLNASRLNREGFRGNLSCPLPCGPLFGIPC